MRRKSTVKLKPTNLINGESVCPMPAQLTRRNLCVCRSVWKGKLYFLLVEHMIGMESMEILENSVPSCACECVWDSVRGNAKLVYVQA